MSMPRIAIVAWIGAALLFRTRDVVAQCEGWALRTPSIAPVARVRTAMAFDTDRDVAVLFGGRYSASGSALALGDTWEWDGTTWWRADVPGPAARERHAMVFDSMRGVTVLFGGFGGGGGEAFGDTWEWDGASWAFRTSVGPGAQFDHAMAFDSSRGVVVLFAAGETWEWDGTTWTMRAQGIGPSRRYSHGMAFDEARGVTVLFGGVLGSEPADTWEWDGATWVVRAPTGPPPRYWHGMAYDSSRAVTLVTGGFNVAVGFPARDDTWAWDGNQWTEVAGAKISARGAAGVAYDTRREVSVAFGGSDSESILGDTWEYGVHYSFPSGAPVAEPFPVCGGGTYASKGRYLTFVPPIVGEGAGGVAFRVTFGPMPDASSCPRVPDFSAFDGVQMWVGPEVIAGSPTGVHPLQATPYFRDWTNPPGIIHVSDCNIVPCATYTIEAIRDVDYPDGPYAAPLVLQTTPLWGDVVGNGGAPADGVVNALDVTAMVNRFKNLPGASPRSWCDLHANSPTQGVNLNIDALDITTVVSAFKGSDYPYSGPSAPSTCP